MVWWYLNWHTLQLQRGPLFLSLRSYRCFKKVEKVPNRGSFRLRKALAYLTPMPSTKAMKAISKPWQKNQIEFDQYKTNICTLTLNVFAIKNLVAQKKDTSAFNIGLLNPCGLLLKIDGQKIITYTKLMLVSWGKLSNCKLMFDANTLSHRKIQLKRNTQKNMKAKNYLNVPASEVIPLYWQYVSSTY